MSEVQTSVAEGVQEAVSESLVDETLNESQENEAQQEAERTVPLSALEAERKKRQEIERKAYEAEYRAQLIEQQMQKSQSPPQDDEDEYTKSLKSWTQSELQKVKRDAAEELYIQQNPDIVSRLQNELPDLYAKRPWLKNAVLSAENRVLAAAQLLDDYAPRNAVANETKKKISENQMKPKSPQGVGKTGQFSKADMIAKMSSSEFQEFRKKQMGRH